MSYDLAESGKRIKELRLRSGMSQDGLGQVLGMTQPCIANIESGRKGTTIDTLVQLADFFHITLDYIVAGKLGDGMFEEVPEDKREKVFNIFREIVGLV